MNKYKLFAQLSRYSLEAQIDDFEKYILGAGGQNRVDLSELKKAYEDEKKNAPDDYINYLEDYYSEQYDFLVNIQPNIFNKSALVSLYSCLEHNLNDYCNICQRIVNTNISVTDFNGDGIHKAKRYLTKLMDINFGLSQEWRFMTEFNKVRNCIVHANGDIKKMSTAVALKDIIDKTPTLSLNNENNIIISLNYLKDTITKIRKLFQWLYTHLDQSSK
ncbi:hypothetical protein RVX07_000635 [Escherichia coli]|uniref:hypothetical protein n=1 Tax=Escherichia coli TaxID=562 RepID=UPI0007515EEB|nr:hypothetical protein [Escherichia coli]EKO6398811.1 hypothetical protein [Escherichia coli]ELK7065610.1 hypothetical protein [Escherichia coli]KUX69979.1 hypothetical protein AWF89_19865 [Escherichia coli]HAI4277045.1 hypothetical protein [Escherichia coli]HCK1166207.1 hypothetical protein [Escherichia coli]